jgi:hypothetical protein
MAGFKTLVKDRYFEDYVPGSVHEFGLIKVEQEDIVAFGRQLPLQLQILTGGLNLSAPG